MRIWRIVSYRREGVMRLALRYRGSDGMVRFECDPSGRTLVFKNRAEALSRITELEEE